MTRPDGVEQRDNGPGNKAFPESQEKPPVPVVTRSTTINSVVAINVRERTMTKAECRNEQSEERASSGQSREEEEQRRRRRRKLFSDLVSR
ncbi:hypothetical protein F2Q68_00008946 [Brassica cretica]|uniref:Uncharacterized protein n=1 Tax=Brassica cretica TaxID=69181 RepID=A0A8S9KR27_BRACR|nr:hypothetical protein F2Q68_00008946 [Brassica cretica]